MRFIDLTKLRFITVFLLLFVFAPAVFPDVVDATFNAQVQTASFGGKAIGVMAAQPDGKTLVSGSFNHYNATPVGRLVRLNADGSLDTTFDNDVLSANSLTLTSILVQVDGKILIFGTFTLADGTSFSGTFIRLNSDGTRDTTFTNAVSGTLIDLKFDAAGRLLVCGYLTYTDNGSTVSKSIVRLLDNGSIDPSFNAPVIPTGPEGFAPQGNKVVYTTFAISGQPIAMFRLNEDGLYDSSFTPTSLGNFQILRIAAQPDGSILGLADNRIFRVSVNGGLDTAFQSTTFSSQPMPRLFVRPDGGFTIGYRTNSPSGYHFKRCLPNGATDPSFTLYNYPFTEIGTFSVTYDGGLLIGDSGIGSVNRFVRVLPSGAADTGYNLGGTGFQSIATGIIRSIQVLPDDKILIGGKFDRVNGAVSFKLARLNADSTLDSTFHLNTTATGNYFSQLNEVYRVSRQSDGKLLVSGNFAYFANSVQHVNVVRLNADGSIDPSFNVQVFLNDYFGSTGLSSNKPVVTPSGKVVVGTTRPALGDPTVVPLMLTAAGAQDTTFTPTLFATKNSVVAFDVAVQADGKIIVAGRHVSGDMTTTIIRGFVARLNTNGSVDTTFTPFEIPDRTIHEISLRPNGQILAVAKSTTQSSVVRLNSDGGLDTTFGVGTGANGVLNTLAVLPDNRIAVGGLFAEFNGAARQNIALLNADGSLGDAIGGVNREVLTVAIDNQGRILIGGMFTAIRDGAQQVNRSYVARLLATASVARAPYFDFDGDGKTDFSIFRPSTGQWWINRSSTAQTTAAQFGSSTDISVPSDFTGDGKTDIAFFRPSTGEWFILRSNDSSFYSIPFGTAGDIPSVGDFDGDGKSDLAVFRPSTSTWFILKSSGGTSIFGFGTSGDKPIAADFDGDGKTDVAVYRPSTGEWWIKRSSNDSVYAFRFGTATDKPTPGDFTGDGRADAAFFRPSTGEWFVLRSEDSSFFSFPFGTAGDLAVPGDYDGDGKFDAAVFRPSTSTWYVNRSTAGIMIAGFGMTGDAPLPNAFVR